ncbi:cation diffusion facilitator family transporter [Compostibacter hankyongensis]|uniref:cation diffusion facilitator family transporter n=1 Tax=Compostibacter hankyongensis TaxID=1007089 RepID=UPI0031E80D70
MKRKEIRIIFISLAVSVLLTAVKFLAWVTTHSVAILSDALESIINVVAGAFALYSVWLTSRPRDENHPYGHGKVEFFSIGFEGAMISVAGCLILYKAIQYFIFPHALQRIGTGIFWVGSTGVVNLLLGLFLIRSGKALPSITIGGNGQHILTDAWSSFALIIALLVIRFTGWHWVDPLASVILAVLILRKGYKLIRRAVSGLMDETDRQMMDEVIAVLSANRRRQWIDIHNMRIQQYGNNYHIDCHLTLPYYYDLNQAHQELKAVAALIDKHFPQSETEFFIHSDPCVPACCRHCILEECPVRSFPFENRITWTRENLLPDHKHSPC